MHPFALYLAATDVEHNRGAAAERIALLRQARADWDALVITRRLLNEGRQVVCSVCRREIDLERVAAVPTTTRCVRCAA